jgi:hypothetical protein
MRCYRTFMAFAALSVALAIAAALPNLGRGQPQAGDQLPHLRLVNVMPCGGKVGSTFLVTIQASDAEEPQSLSFSHPGIKAELVVEKEPKADEPKKDDAKKDPKKQEQKKQPKQQAKPIQFHVTVAGDVPVGSYDVRLVGKYGISNARTFVVGDLAEVQEKEPNNDVEQAQRIDLNSTVNGVILQPTDVDYYVFKASKGQRVLVECRCASIDSRLTPDLKILDRQGREIAARHAAPLRDALLDFTAAEDGDYTVRLSQFAYQMGGQDAFYRLSVTTGPWIDAVFPPMIEPGKPAQVTVYGRNLPGGQLDEKTLLGGRTLEKLIVTVTAPAGAAQQIDFSGRTDPLIATQDGFEYRIKNGPFSSNGVLLTYARAPVILEQEPNDTPETAQEVAVPCEIAGRINKNKDRDWYVFSAKKGDTFMIDLISNRLGADTDLFMTIRNATGKDAVNMAQLDDNADSLHPIQLQTSSRDPAPYRFVAPADGKYQILVGSHLSTTVADLQQYYRLRIAPETPDFRLFVMPSDTFRPDSCQLGAGGNQELVVFILRQDGFQGEIELTATGLPPGVTCKNVVVGAGMRHGSLVVTAAADASPWTGTIQVRGSAIIRGAAVERDARPASITWQVQPQSGIPTITRLERSLVLAVRGKAPYGLTCGMDRAVVVHGGKVSIPMKLTRHWPEFKSQLSIMPIPNELPPGMSYAPLNFPPGKDEQTLNLNVPANVAPGKYTVVFQSFAPIPVGPKNKAVNVVQCSSAVLLVVIPKQVATLTAAVTGPGIKPGEQADLVVKVARQHNYAGEFKVKLVFPPDLKGLSADETTIPAGQNEAKIVVHADPEAAPGPRNNLAVVASATLEGVALVHEIKLNVNVIK